MKMILILMKKILMKVKKSLELIRRKIKIIEHYLKELYKDFKINEKENINLKVLIPEKIFKKIENNELVQIILVKDCSSKNNISEIIFNLINTYINSNGKYKNELLINHKEEFIKIYRILLQKEKISEESSIIHDYNKCK